MIISWLGFLTREWILFRTVMLVSYTTTLNIVCSWISPTRHFKISSGKYCHELSLQKNFTDCSVKYTLKSGRKT